MQFNTLLSDQLRILTEELGIRITLFDTFSLGKQILEDARYNGGKTFGITNVDTPIFPRYAGSTGADPAISLFCDDLHISAVAHDLLGDAVFSYLVRPTLTLTINQKVFSSGDTLQVSLDVNNPGTSFAGDPLLVEVISTVDIYFGVLLPDGDSIAFFSTLDFNPKLGSLSHVATLSPLISNVDLSSQLTVDDLSFFSFTWTGNEPTGTYVLFLAAVVPGAFADGSVDQGDIVTLSTVTFSLIP